MSVHFKKIKPLLNRVVILKEQSKKVTKGGIILKQEETLSYGKVIAVGPGRRFEEADKLRPLQVEVG